MTLRRRVAVLAVVGVAFVLGIGWVVAARFADAVQAGTAAVGRLDPAAAEADTLVLQRVRTEGALQDLVLTGSRRHLVAFRADLRAGDAAAEALRVELGGDPAFAGLLDAEQIARTAWWTVDAGPTLAAVEQGDLARAATVTQSSPARTAYADLVAAAVSIQDAVDERRAAAFADLERFTRQLALALAAAGVLLLLGLGLVVALLHRWVLRPLDALRRQLRAVARRGDHDRPIVPAGPRELAAVGSDAEAMRRQLVTEIDEARSAREALAQDAPLVAAIRAELAAPADPQVPGLLVHGEVYPAEGVLAGDAWLCLTPPGGRSVLAVVDVSGHGPAAGITALRVKHVLTAAVRAGRGPAAALTEVAETFAREEDRFATAVVVAVDPATGDLTWANAGHPAPLLVTAAGSVRPLPPTGPLLSTLGGRWTERSGRLGQGELLLLVTDGVLESRGARGRELGEVGLQALVADVQGRVGAMGPGASLDPAGVAAALVAQVRARAADWRRDDATVVAVAVAPSRP